MQTDLLAGLRILVTRPVHQANVFCKLIGEQGGQALRLPVIKIEAIELSQQTSEVIREIETVDFAIFISPNAVTYGLDALLAHGEIPDKLKLVTIGKASAEKMQKLLGRSPDIYPIQQYNSEALLALDSMQEEQVNNKRVIIFRGVGGRELLATSLKERGARVDYAEVYQRTRPEPESHVLESLWKDDCVGPDIITVTSNEGLNNLLEIHDCPRFSKKSCYLEQLWQTPLIVVTEKMRMNAQALGFKSDILVAAKASNEALLERVMEWAKIRTSINKKRQ
ncbi:MAG: uroporphyrinogen-III synthase [Gammaproteobacteria bacterium]|nr:uroporphyrinogen-III synthase [Gammaproteobacteria bacterium]